MQELLMEVFPMPDKIMRSHGCKWAGEDCSAFCALLHGPCGHQGCDHVGCAGEVLSLSALESHG